MTFQHEKTGQHLREHVIREGSQERLRAMQCLSQCYGTGSRAALAKMLLATLGTAPTMDNTGDQYNTTPVQTDTLAKLTITQVADPLQASANSSRHSLQDASSAN